MLDYYTDDTIAAASPGMYLAIVLRVEYDGDNSRVDANERFIENNNWADLFYGHPDTFELEDDDNKQDPPRLMKIRARVPDLDYYKPVPETESDEERMKLHSVFTAISEDVTALGVPSPGELIWVGFANVSDATYPYYVTRVKSTRPVVQPAPGGGTTAIGSIESSTATSATMGDFKGARQVKKYVRPIYSLFFSTGNAKYDGGEKGFQAWTEMLKRTPKRNQGLYSKKGFSEGSIFFDDTYGALSRFIACSIKSMGVVAIIEQYLNSYGNSARVKITSGLRAGSGETNHGNGVAMDLKIMIDGVFIPKEQVYGIIAKLIEAKKLPKGGLGLYIGISADPSSGTKGRYKINYEKNANVHYDFRGTHIGKSWAPMFKSKKGGARWVWMCMHNDKNGRCKGKYSKSDWQLKNVKSAYKGWKQSAGGRQPILGGSPVDDPNLDSDVKLSISEDSYQKLKNVI